MLVHRLGARKVCLFSSYFKSNQIPYYVKFYLKELRRHFDQVVMLTNNDRDIESADISWLETQGIDLMPVPNEGFDFGMWQKALSLLDLGQLACLALVNDSCILFAPLDDYFQWLARVRVDVAGMTESYEKTRHLQSFFLVFQGEKAIAAAAGYIAESPVSGLDYQEIVNTFELGLSRHLYANESLVIKPRYQVEPLDGSSNPSYVYLSLLIAAGMPLIKKRIVAKEGIGIGMKKMIREGRSPRPEGYVRSIREKYALSQTEVDGLFADVIKSGRKNAPQFWRRYLRYRLFVFLGLLQRQKCGAKVIA